MLSGGAMYPFSYWASTAALRRGSLRAIAISALIGTLSSILPAWTNAAEPPAEKCKRGERIGYLGSHDTSSSSVVVFVHGVLSNSYDAWTYTRWIGENSYWPCLLRAESAFKTTNIYVHNYRTA